MPRRPVSSWSAGVVAEAVVAIWPAKIAGPQAGLQGMDLVGRRGRAALTGRWACRSMNAPPNAQRPDDAEPAMARAQAPAARWLAATRVSSQQPRVTEDE